MKLGETLSRTWISMSERASESMDRTVEGGYVSDLLSDVIAGAKEGDLWLTLQVH
jgi:hypothetical protein